MPQLSARVTSSGSKNATLQVQGVCSGVDGFGPAWVTLVKLAELPNPSPHLRIDAIYHVLAEGMEVQLAWRNGSELQPIMPLAGRGRIDFSEVSGLHALLETPSEEIVLRVVSEAKNPSPCFLLVLDLSKHQGTL